MRETITEELERVGFTVTQCPSFYDRENLEGVRVIRAYNAEERQTAALIAASDDVLANNKKVEAIMAPRMNRLR